MWNEPRFRSWSLLFEESRNLSQIADSLVIILTVVFFIFNKLILFESFMFISILYICIFDVHVIALVDFLVTYQVCTSKEFVLCTCFLTFIVFTFLFTMLFPLLFYYCRLVNRK